VCGKTYHGQNPLAGLRYHEARSGHLQKSSVDRGVTQEGLTEWLEQFRKQQRDSFKRRTSEGKSVTRGEKGTKPVSRKVPQETPSTGKARRPKAPYRAPTNSSQNSIQINCTKCGRAFHGRHAKWMVERHMKNVRNCAQHPVKRLMNDYKLRPASCSMFARSAEEGSAQPTQQRVSGNKRGDRSASESSTSGSASVPAHTVPSKVTATRPAQRRRRRSLGSLHSSEQGSDGSEGVWVSAVPANARPRTPDTTFSSHGKGEGQSASSGDPDAILFPPEIREKNDRREKKNKRKRMHDWVNSFAGSTEDDASQGTSTGQAESASVDLQSYFEPVLELPASGATHDAQLGDLSIRGRKSKRRKESPVHPRCEAIDIRPSQSLAQPASTLHHAGSGSQASRLGEESSHNSHARKSHETTETYWKATDFEDIVAISFKYQARYATPWPESMHEEHFIMITQGESEMLNTVASNMLEQHNHELQAEHRSWLSNVTESVWNTLKRSGSCFSPRTIGA
jgi:hypothetical protein